MEPSSNCGHDNLGKCMVDIPPSPVHNLLNTNQPPSATETVLAHTAIADNSDDLQHLEECVRVQSVLDELESRRDALREYRDAHKGVISPIRKLPPETLGAIFLYSLPEHYEPTDDFYFSAQMLDSSGDLYRAAVSKLELVCRKWKEVSISTPQLWSRFSLDSGRNHVKWVDRWLQRSGEVPLSIQYTFSSPYWDMAPAPFIPSHAHRWQSADLQCDKKFWEKFSSSVDQLPLLRTLSINTQNRWGIELGEDIPSYLTIQLNTPSLRSLHLSSTRLGRLPTLQLSFSQLTYLSLHTHSSYAMLFGNDHKPVIGPRRLVAMLRETRNLIAVSLAFEEHMDQLDSTPGGVPAELQIHLPHLRSLCVSGDAPLTLFPYLNTPALKKFRYCTRVSSGLVNAFASLVSRSRCRIETLEIVAEWVDPGTSDSESLIQLLELTSDLTTLEIKDSSAITEALIRRLHRNDIGSLPHLVPGLKHLTMRAPLSLPSIKSFMDMIESRLEPDVSDHDRGTFQALEVVSLSQNDSLDHSDADLDDSARMRQGERLMALKAKGHRIVTQSCFERIFFTVMMGVGLQWDSDGPLSDGSGITDSPWMTPVPSHAFELHSSIISQIEI